MPYHEAKPIYALGERIMISSYAILADYVRGKAADPLNAAKVINDWAWTSLLPGGYGATPTDAQDVPDVMNATCAWRSRLMIELFSEIGVKGRLVNFYDVPFQVGHTCVELNIGGKWVFFDPTFGTYFTAKGGTTLLSTEEARAAWPAVDVYQSTLPGWTGSFAEPDSLSPSASARLSEALMMSPTSIASTARGDVVGGEWNSLYFGSESAYFYDKETGYGPKVVITPLPPSGANWITVTDSNGSKPYKDYVQNFDARGKLITENGLYDDGGRWFAEFDAYNRYDWVKKLSYTTVNSVIDRSSTYYDNGNVLQYDNDQTRSFDWKDKSTLYNSANRAISQSGRYDDGRSWAAEWDISSKFNWQSRTFVYAENGDLLSLYTLNDNNTKLFIQYNESTSLPWRTISTVTSSDNRVDYTTTINRDGTRMLLDNDLIGNLDHISKTTWYNAAGAPVRQTGSFRDDRTWASWWDADNSKGWVSTSSVYDRSGKLDTSYTLNDNGSQLFVDYDQNEIHQWHSVTTLTSADKKTDYITTVMDDGSKTIIDFDLLNEHNFSVKITSYAQNGRAIYQSGDYDDGRSWVTNWDIDDNELWTHKSDVYDSDDFLVSSYSVNDDTTTTYIAHDSRNNHDWNHQISTFDASGNLISFQSVSDDYFIV